MAGIKSNAHPETRTIFAVRCFISCRPKGVIYLIYHYSDVITGVMPSQITRPTIVYLIVYSSDDQKTSKLRVIGLSWSGSGSRSKVDSLPAGVSRRWGESVRSMGLGAARPVVSALIQASGSRFHSGTVGIKIECLYCSQVGIKCLHLCSCLLRVRESEGRSISSTGMTTFPVTVLTVNLM